MTHGATFSVAMIITALAGAGAYGLVHRAPGCESDWTLQRTYATLRDKFQLSSIYINNVENVDGGYFAAQRDCSAQVAEIRGNVSLADTQWRALSYSISSSSGPANPGISVQLGDRQPYIKPPPTLLGRLFGPT